ncbi:DNA-entry nuclease (plasmid) [Paenibacillus rhizovicinus]|uniref:DNA-entry nuclease n=2 Tax=Paenibacillus rhizovicinus TaxID=2704463 RepID=A0A6C0PBS9_9BACL|nr:DNA-entry nuclease [Paenibacillus rhizovicinus]
MQGDGVRYDRYNRMLYHPDYHPNQGKPYTTKENAYLCKHYIRGQVKTLALDMGRTEHSIRQHVNELRRLGQFDHYKSMVFKDE